MKKLGGMEFFDVHFSYINNKTLEEFFVNVPKRGGSNLIPEGLPKPGVVHLVTKGATGQLGLYRFETQMTAGNGRHSASGFGSNTSAKESLRVGFDYFKGNLNRISATAKFPDHEYQLHAVELHNTGPSNKISLASLIAFCSILMNRYRLLLKEIYNFVTKIQAITPIITITQAHRNGIAAVPMPKAVLTTVAAMQAKVMNKDGIHVMAGN